RAAWTGGPTPLTAAPFSGGVPRSSFGKRLGVLVGSTAVLTVAAAGLGRGLDTSAPASSSSGNTATPPAVNGYSSPAGLQLVIESASQLPLFASAPSPADPEPAGDVHTATPATAATAEALSSAAAGTDEPTPAAALATERMDRPAGDAPPAAPAPPPPAPVPPPVNVYPAVGAPVLIGAAGRGQTSSPPP